MLAAVQRVRASDFNFSPPPFPIAGFSYYDGDAALPELLPGTALSASVPRKAQDRRILMQGSPTHLDRGCQAQNGPKERRYKEKGRITSPAFSHTALRTQRQQHH